VRRRRSRLATTRSTGILIGLVLDHLLTDPQRGHPVAGFGTAASWAEKRLWRDDRRAGVGYVAACVGLPLVAATVIQNKVRRPVVSTALLATVTWTTLGGSSLRREGRQLGKLLDSGNIEGARSRLGYLCGRDPSTLDETELARATVESVAENTSDAVVAPLLASTRVTIGDPAHRPIVPRRRASTTSLPKVHCGACM